MKPYKGREDIYQQVSDLHITNRWSAYKIAQTLAMPYSTIRGWLSSSPIKSPRGNFAPRIIPNLQPSPELAYLLGATLGDGWVGNSKTKWNGRIVLQATDLEFVQEYTRCLKNILGREYPIVKKNWKDNPRWKPFWRVTAHSCLLAEYLRQPLEAFNSLLQTYPGDYLRGFFDAEGSAHQRQQNGRPYWILSICNTKKALIDLPNRLLEDIGIIGHRYIKHREKDPSRKPLYIWYCEKRKYLYRFRELVNFTIPRKSAILATLP